MLDASLIVYMFSFAAWRGGFMHSSQLSRGLLHLGLALVVLGGLWLAGSLFATDTLRAVGLDWWNVATALRDEARSRQSVLEAEEIRREMLVLAEVREQVLAEVISGRKTLSEGLVRLQDLHNALPSFRRCLEEYYCGLPQDQALLTYYRVMLEDAMEQHPMAVAHLRPEFDELFGRHRTSKPMS
jgi:hypothetical protein